MSDLIERLRGAGYLGASGQYISNSLCCEAADEIERLRHDYLALERNYDQLAHDLARSMEAHTTALNELAEANEKATRYRREWQRECDDGDSLLQMQGLCPSEYRTDGGSLMLDRIRHAVRKARERELAAVCFFDGRRQGDELDRLRRELAEAQRDRQSEHDLRVRLTGELETARELLGRWLTWASQYVIDVDADGEFDITQDPIIDLIGATDEALGTRTPLTEETRQAQAIDAAMGEACS